MTLFSGVKYYNVLLEYIEDEGKKRYSEMLVTTHWTARYENSDFLPRKP